MRKFLEKLTRTSEHDAYNIGCLLIRLAAGTIFFFEGLKKLMRGEEEILWLGQQLSNLGIDFLPLFFGYCAAFTELLGGLCLVLGLVTRFATLGLSFTMVVALSYHFTKGDPFGFWAYPLLCLIIFIAFFIMGGTRYSVDTVINRRLRSNLEP